ncbi:glucokinase regulatory protein [Renibacterium salmoninarum ATCC 33209]|uniref:Glucokinase regulatory protein n=1 Tax=Renibacterium salmoninarum (strain ATCC 33209 / DSM 20767 / JCM 11484 / NBRC 15589 / NCIMB 2235) TaxID=288705 RepID=A9WLS4_RENSM|nr:glucokinase regulatory protein [Renibacterium salmoninarum ATCC 33209]
MDSVLGVSASGRTPYVLGSLDAASARGALTIGFSCNASSPLGQQANFALDIEVGPEFVVGSTRLKAGTTQKLVLNMISTITMIRLGKTYRNLMVDLQATNAKLRARSERTVIQATGADLLAAQSALTAASGSVKVAILMILAGFSATEAVKVLAQNHGRLSQALHAE